MPCFAASQPNAAGQSVDAKARATRASGAAGER